ncbi:unnamed protein product [Mycena citricolor]|uniref:NAD(P)-binding protein n=1 Tax=Mycena citricolor TaxID=2018698 RepID=A0AAD2I1J4_9AGAR|nr:unnamed protein product [Mycena citricolor]
MALAQVLKSNSSWAPRAKRPVALFLGGTSGIGQAMARRLADYTANSLGGGSAHIIILGRNRAAAERTTSSFPREPEGRYTSHEFIECDATLMRDVRRVTGVLLARRPPAAQNTTEKINYLVLSPGFFSIVAGRDETAEGIDRKLALLYYARWKFIYDLLPLLQNAANDGEEASVYSVLGAGTGSEVDVDDLGLKKHYSAIKAATVSASYTDLAMEKLAADNPDISFNHAFPGLVRTPMMMPKHPLLKPFSPLIKLAAQPFTVSAETCAEYQLSGLFSSTPGFTRRGSKGQDIGYSVGDPAVVQKLWEHTLSAVGA